MTSRPTRARAHLALARISNSPTIVSNVLAGAALAGAFGYSYGTSSWFLLLLSVAMVLYYTAGMYLNDLFDLEQDRLERPERPLPSGTISEREALAVTVLLFSAGTFCLALLGTAPLVSGLVLVGLIVVYDAWHKTNPLSPVLMASTRVMVYITAFVAFAPLTFTGGVFSSFGASSALVFWSLLLGLYILGLTYIAKTETHTLTGYWPALLLFLPPLVAAAMLPWTSFWLPLGFALWVAYSVTFVYFPERQVGRAIGQLIAGVPLLDALVLALFGAFAGVGVALSAFVLTLFLQRYIKGT